MNFYAPLNNSNKFALGPLLMMEGHSYSILFEKKDYTVVGQLEKLIG